MALASSSPPARWTGGSCTGVQNGDRLWGVGLYLLFPDLSAALLLLLLSRLCFLHSTNEVIFKNCIFILESLTDVP